MATSDGPPLRLRDIGPDDRARVLALNAADVEYLAPLDDARLTELLGWVAHGQVVVDDVSDEDALGFVLTFGPATPYDSPNYRWFGERYERFLYLDRIVVAPEARRRGVGMFVYDAMEAAAAARGGPLLCEVNIDPPNEVSLAFHRRRGYRELGRLGPSGKEVLLFEGPTRIA